MKFVQIKSQGPHLKEDLLACLKQMKLSLSLVDQINNKIFCYVKDKRIFDLHFQPLKNSLVSILFDSILFKEEIFSIKPEMIVYEDDALVVLDKPYGIATQSTQVFGQDYLYGALISYYTEKNPKKLAYVGLHHRLDRDTSGLVLFTKKTSANKSIAEQFQKHQIYKKYYAFTSGPTPKSKEWVVDAPIARDYKSKWFKCKIDPKGEKALSTFRLLQAVEEGGVHFIECEPKTGRTHQLRVHLSSCDLPIIGDRTYGGLSHPRMMLHAFELTIHHPLNGKKLQLSSNIHLEKFL